MTRIRSIDVVSAANLFAVACGAFGILYLLLAVLRDQSTIYAPLGLVLPHVGLKINLTLGRQFFGIPMLLAPPAYAVSGWVSGAICAVFYNGVAHFGVGLKVHFKE